MDRHRLIVGVDYGTTYSGVSYVTTDKKTLDDIIVLQHWPGKSSGWKAPTRIAYASENSKASLTENQWGYRALPPMVMCSWTKLLLDASTKPAENDDPRLQSDIENHRLRLPSHRDAQGVVADYLRELYAHLQTKVIKDLGKEVFDSTPMDVWLTVPATWSDQAQNSTKEAALEAGFGGRPGDTISIMFEPEAAAVAVLKQMTHPEALNKPSPGENIMICDCGGGTVDITTYTIGKIEPKPAFEEACVGKGAKCGSTSIDRAFHDLMRKRFGSSWDDIEERRKGAGSNFMEQWERVKCSFGDTGDDRPHELQLNIKGHTDPQWYDEDEGMVKLTREDVRGLFDPTIQQITALVSQQHQAIKTKGKSLDRLVLVGGFGDSEYLFTKLKEWCAANGKVRAYCPPHCQAAIVRGAALRGLIGIAPRARRCRRHYGCEVSSPFRDNIDPESDSYLDKFTSRKMCRHRMMWMINKDAEITEDTKATHSLSLTQKVNDPDKTCELRLYSCDDDKASDRRTTYTTDFVGKVVVDFGKVNLGSYKKKRNGSMFGSQYQEIPFDVQVNFGDQSGLLGVRALCEGIITGSAEMVFDQ